MLLKALKSIVLKSVKGKQKVSGERVTQTLSNGVLITLGIELLETDKITAIILIVVGSLPLLYNMYRESK